MGYAPATPAGAYAEVGTPRAKRTPRVYEPEEDEYPIGGYEEEPAAEAGETAPATDEALAAPAADATGTAEEK